MVKLPIKEVRVRLCMIKEILLRSKRAGLWCMLKVCQPCKLGPYELSNLTSFSKGNSRLAIAILFDILKWPVMFCNFGKLTVLKVLLVIFNPYVIASLGKERLCV